MTAKQKMISAMNGLVYEHPEPVTFVLDETTRAHRFASFIDWAAPLCNELASFLAENEEGFYDNKTVVDFKMWVYSSETIPAGMKIGKAINKYFLPIYGAAVTEPIRIEASRLIQENSVTGKLCLSVHPLDYLSISENNHNWRSCHALDGEYRSGNLSYMVDECTIVVYLKSEEEVILPRFPEEVPWNNKKWRCLLYFDFKRNLVWAGKQYPFSCKASLPMVEELLLKPLNYFCDKRQTASFYRWSHCTFKGETKIGEMSCFLNEPYIVYNNHLSALKNWVQDEKGSMQFNDLINSSTYTPEMLQFGYNIYNMHNEAPLKIGGPVHCVRCGKQDIEFSETMMCKQCTLDSGIEMEEIGHCACCGERIFLELDYSYGDSYYCPECYNEHIVYCSTCGDVFYAGNKEDYYVEDLGIYECRYCRKHHLKSQFIKSLFEKIRKK